LDEISEDMSLSEIYALHLAETKANMEQVLKEDVKIGFR
jgi:hypothetical protein